jgi:hypothetical protein
MQQAHTLRPVAGIMPVKEGKRVPEDEFDSCATFRAPTVHPPLTAREGKLFSVADRTVHVETVAHSAALAARVFLLFAVFLGLSSLFL